MNSKNAFNQSSKVLQALLALESDLPRSKYEASANPQKTASAIATGAAWKCALISSAASLPPGPIGAVTALFNTFAIQKTQRQMLADLAAVYGKSPRPILSQQSHTALEQHAAKKASNAAVRFGRAKLMGKTLSIPNRAFAKVGGVAQTQLAVRYGLARCLPILGAAGVGTFTYFETRKIAAEATLALGRQDESTQKMPTKMQEAKAGEQTAKTKTSAFLNTEAKDQPPSVERVGTWGRRTVFFDPANQPASEQRELLYFVEGKSLCELARNDKHATITWLDDQEKLESAREQYNWHLKVNPLAVEIAKATSTFNVDALGDLKTKCKECDGDGEWFDTGKRISYGVPSDGPPIIERCPVCNGHGWLSNIYRQ